MGIIAVRQFAAVVNLCIAGCGDGQWDCVGSRVHSLPAVFGQAVIPALLQHGEDRETAGFKLDGFAVQGGIHRLHFAGFVKVQNRKFFFRVHRRADQQDRHPDILRRLIAFAGLRIHKTDVEGSGKAELRRRDAELGGALVDIIPVGVGSDDQLFHRELCPHRNAAVGGIAHADLIGISVRVNQSSGERDVPDHIFLFVLILLRILFCLRVCLFFGLCGLFAVLTLGILSLDIFCLGIFCLGIFCTFGVPGLNFLGCRLCFLFPVRRFTVLRGLCLRHGLCRGNGIRGDLLRLFRILRHDIVIGDDRVRKRNLFLLQDGIGTAVRVTGGAIMGQSSTVGIHDRPIGIYHRSVGIHDRPVRVRGRSVRVQRRPVGVHRGAVRVDCRSVGMNRRPVRVHRGPVGIDNSSVSIHRGSVRVNRRTVSVHRGAVGMDRRSVGIHDRPVGIHDSSVDIDGGAVRISRGSIGIDDLSIRIYRGSVRVNRRTVSVHRGPIGIDHAPVGVRDRTVGIHDGSVRINGASFGIDRFLRRLCQRFFPDGGRSE